MTETPNSPWEKVSIDFCGPLPSGDYLLVVIDDYSRFPEVEILKSTSSRAVKRSEKCHEKSYFLSLFLFNSESLAKTFQTDTILHIW